MQSGDLDCAPSDVVISYVMHSREKVNPTIINSDVCVLTYIMDADVDGFRPILRINVVEWSFEGPLNSSAPPLRCPTVDDDLIDDDLNDYKNNVDNTINMEDYSMHMEDFSSYSQDDEEDRETESQAGHSFTDRTNFCCGQTFTDKKEVKMQLDATAARQSFNYYMEKSCTKLMKVQCLSRGCGWLLRVKKYDTSDRFCIYKYVGMHTYGVENATCRHKKVSSELIASVCVNHFRDAFGACIRGYAHMRKVIVVDCTYLYGKYGGVLLSAVAQDTKNYIFSIAFCVVDKENDASWTFFFQKLKFIIEDEPDLCVISDRHISITNAFSRVYICTHHRLCMRHLAKNFRVNQHCGEHLYLFYAAAKAYSFDEFSDNFVELKSKCHEAAHVLKNVLGFEKWSRSHFLGNRYDVMTTSIAESLNSILMDEREYPMSYIFNSIAKKFGEKFRERHAFVSGKENIFVPSAERILIDNKSGSDSLYVGNPNGVLNEYTMFSNGVTAKVNLLEKSCSCQKFDLVKMPGEHAMAALRAKYGDDEDYGNSIFDYSSPIYKAERYFLVYSKVINVVPPKAEWTMPQELVDTKISPPPYDPKLGRKKFKHTKGVGETFKSKRRNRFSICKKSGHKRTTCRMGIKS
ncbi:hypothetical protein P3S68_023173 [Capsicum galapagoense]